MRYIFSGQDARTTRVYCMTFDQLYDDLLFRLENYQLAAEVDN